MKRVLRIMGLVVGMWLLFSGTVMCIETFDRSKFKKERVEKLVSIEYLTTCPKCGNDKMEGYYSLVDGYNYENCKNCWYYTDNVIKYE